MYSITIIDFKILQFEKKNNIQYRTGQFSENHYREMYAFQ